MLRRRTEEAAEAAAAAAAHVIHFQGEHQLTYP